MKPPNIWRIFSSLFSVCNQVKERRAARRATSSLDCYAEPRKFFSGAKEHFLFPTDRDGSHCFHSVNLFIYLINALTIGHWGRYIGSLFLDDEPAPVLFYFTAIFKLSFPILAITTVPLWAAKCAVPSIALTVPSSLPSAV